MAYPCRIRQSQTGHISHYSYSLVSVSQSQLPFFLFGELITQNDLPSACPGLVGRDSPQITPRISRARACTEWKMPEQILDKPESGIFPFLTFTSSMQPAHTRTTYVPRTYYIPYSIFFATYVY